MIKWMYFPKSDRLPPHLSDFVERVFKKNQDLIDSSNHEYVSDVVLAMLRDDITACGYEVEGGKSASQKISIPVLFGLNGRLDKSFDADAYDGRTNTVVEIEASRAYANHQFLKDFFEACIMHDVDYLVIAVRHRYKKTPDFEKIIAFFEAMYASGRLNLPLKGILIVGY